MYAHYKVTDPECVKRRPGFSITVVNSLVLCKYKLQTKTALSTMEAEIISMPHRCRELFPIMDMVDILLQ